MTRCRRHQLLAMRQLEAAAAADAVPARCRPPPHATRPPCCPDPSSVGTPPRTGPGKVAPRTRDLRPRASAPAKLQTSGWCVRTHAGGPEMAVAGRTRSPSPTMPASRPPGARACARAHSPPIRSERSMAPRVAAGLRPPNRRSRPFLWTRGRACPGRSSRRAWSTRTHLRTGKARPSRSTCRWCCCCWTSGSRTCSCSCTRWCSCR
mmetsp:Transcript_36718/g.93565  ORF Transcript_36718/g.93565 Transcript_36718/m.93565 type:complete len:207 (+) Transcript_36718:108-728(+)